MWYIAHRGNRRGPNPTRENSPDYILEAVAEGFDVEIDVRRIGGRLYLGHDGPQYETTLEFLNNSHFWVHAKNGEALFFLISNGIRCFSHNTDEYTLTSTGVIWAYPGLPVNDRCIAVMPEWFPDFDWSQACGVCSDLVGKYRDADL